jgi:hypothetical protein
VVVVLGASVVVDPRMSEMSICIASFCNSKNFSIENGVVGFVGQLQFKKVIHKFKFELDEEKITQ